MMILKVGDWKAEFHSGTRNTRGRVPHRLTAPQPTTQQAKVARGAYQKSSASNSAVKTWPCTSFGSDQF